MGPRSLPGGAQQDAKAGVPHNKGRELWGKGYCHNSHCSPPQDLLQPGGLRKVGILISHLGDRGERGGGAASLGDLFKVHREYSGAAYSASFPTGSSLRVGPLALGPQPPGTGPSTEEELCEGLLTD